jgi:hypothetical protein
MKKILSIVLASFCSLLNANAADVDVSADISSDTTWSASNTYILKDYIFVEPGATLTIEAGTTIKADQGSGTAAPALIVTQGAKINAVGTATNPIVFTSVLDTGSLTKDNKGLWGGLIILGNAPINSNGGSNADNTPLTNTIEGVPTTSGISGRTIPASYSQYGGTNASDDSGTLQYVSIRHGGAEIGSGNEINGLTLGGVGNGTTIDHIEVFANKDDGIEFFGGSVNAKFLSVAYVGDDSFDFDEGYNGHLQFLLSIQDESSNRAFEWDGSTESDDLNASTSTLPHWSAPVISNVTAIGIGKTGTSVHEDDNVGLEIRDNAGGQVWNSIFTEFAKSIMDVEATSSSKGTVSDTNSSLYGSQALMQNGVLVFQGNLFYNGGHTDGNTALGTAEGDANTAAAISATDRNNTFSTDPLLIDVDDANGSISPFPSASSPALSGANTLSNTSFLTQTTFRGAFSNTNNWLNGWTVVDSTGITTDLAVDGGSGSTVNISANITTDTTWTASNTYVLKDYIFVEPGATLTIEAGTTIKADVGSGDSAPALIVTQGAKINATGTAANPIVFTSVSDTGSNLTKDNKGLWGGLIILGKAPINSNGGSNADNTPLTNTIEGVPTTSGISGKSIPASYSLYGGTDASDDSGILQYVSIRHGGAEIGSGNEINGLTLGGVGNGTTINNIEVFANKDDGIEFFGGSVNAKYLAVAYVGDDSFDFDEGYNGHLQFLLSIQDESSNRAFEWDGSTESDDKAADTSTLPDYSAPVISNVTAIGIGKTGTSAHEDNNIGLEIRDNAGGQVWNSIFTEFAKSIMDVEATSSSKGTVSDTNSSLYGSQALMQNGLLVFQGNLFYNGGHSDGNTALGTAEGDANTAAVISATDRNNTFSTDPLLTDTDDADGSLSPFPTSSSPALSGANTLADTSFLTQTAFRGAFSASNNWLNDWTKIDADGITAELTVDSGTGTTVNVNANISADTTWSATNTYVLKDYIFVEPGATLTIEAGTTIKADVGSGDSAPALIVTQGAKINAAGTAANPIIFTSVNDNGSLTKDNKGLWGGLIILGNAPINSNGGSNADNSPLTNTIEGVPTTSGISGKSIPASYSQYGGTNAADNSGVLQYVSIRHGGAEIGSGNEINGLTLGGVGNGTTIDHIEIFANKDDGIEFFGGSVNARFLSVLYVGDDSFDFDEGYNGELQFLLSVQDESSNRAFEWDGSTESDDKAADTSTLPDYSAPVISNVTAIGIGKTGTSAHEDNNIGLEIRDNAGGQVWNSIFTEFAKSIMDVEATSSSKGTVSDTNSSLYGSQALMQNGVLVFKGNLFYNGGHADGNTASGTAEGDSVTASALSASGNNNSFNVDPALNDVDDTDGAINPVPATSSPALTGAETLGTSSFLTQTTYRGAFDGSNNWLEGWSLADTANIVNHPTGSNINVTANITSDTTWTAINTYVLKDYIFVEPGATLTIQAGTTIKADQGSGDAAPALIVTQGAKINAAGTALNPIVFTSILDGGALTKDNKGLWGGLIILGKAPINSNGGSNADNTPLTNTIEGVPTTSGISGKSIPASYSLYGGTDASDNSGVLQYVSIRHGGAEIGSGNEINGLTLGGVGNGTTINNIEVFANKDDGIEFFGGSVNAKYLAVAYVGDDSFDFDEGYNGHLQFLLSIQDEKSNRAFEWDGSTESDDLKADTSTLPDYSAPVISNVTAIGIGKDGTSTHEDNNIGLEIRDNAGGQVWNSIFTEFAKSIMDVEATSSSKGTVSDTNSSLYGSQALMQNGLLVFQGNLFYNGGHTDGNTASGTAEGDANTAAALSATDRNNTFATNPLLTDTDGSDNVLAPFPSSSSPALSGANTLADTSFLTQTTFRGAFSSTNNWLNDWTKIDADGITAELTVDTGTGTTVNVNANIATDTTWSASYTYVLKDYIFVEPGATLTIEAGTTIKADVGTGDSAPALIVTQGAKINATGTSSNPIIFTSVNDTGSLTKDDKGLWGGLIILGNAPINSNGGSNTDNSPLTNTIEGVPTTSGISGKSIPASYSQYGGTNAADNSGVLQYVSIRHGGAEIGAGNEINGLTLGGVGNGTTISNIEVFANKDDGIEFFGGSVNAKHLVVAYVGDDSFDFDEGYNGHLQFLVSLQDEKSNRAFEWDGSTESDDLKADTSTLPDYSAPVISNVTAIGIGKNGNSTHEDNNIGLEIRDNAGGQVWNSIFTEFAKSIMDVEATSSSKGTVSDTNSSLYGSQALMQNGVLVFKGNLFYNGGHADGNTASGTAEGDSVTAAALSASGMNNSFYSDPKLAVSGTAGGTGINAWSAHPRSGSPALSGAETLASTSFLTQTTYKGAFDGTSDWTTWTKVTQDTYLAPLTSDFDADSLTLAQEISSSYNTDPSLADTDGDGVNDNLDDPIASQNARLVSVNVRGQIGAGDDKRIMGFILSASGDVLMRGIGPTLTEYGLPSSSLLADPKISLFKYNDATNISLGSTAVSEGDNDNYSTNSNLTAIESARTSLTPVVSLNAVQAISLPTLTTGFYTCQVEDVNGGTGIGVAAVDLVNSPSAAFTHLSSRGPVSTGEFMFGSFQITGSGTRKVFIRGRGPSLTQYGVPGVMADTKIVLYKYVNDPNDDQTVNPAVLVGENDNFGTNASASEISSLSTSLYGWPVIETSEAALLIDLDPGYYSAQLQSTSAANDGNGWIGIDDVTSN